MLTKYFWMCKNHEGLNPTVNNFVPCSLRDTQLIKIVPVELISMKTVEFLCNFEKPPLVQFVMEKETFSQLIFQPVGLLGEMVSITALAHVARFLHRSTLSRTGTRPYRPICWELFPL